MINKILLESLKSGDVAYCEGTVEEFIEVASQLGLDCDYVPVEYGFEFLAWNPDEPEKAAQIAIGVADFGEEPKDRLRSYLQQVAERAKSNPDREGWVYKSFAELLLDKGQFLEPKECWTIFGDRYCFFDCQIAALDSQDFIYWEGYAIADDSIFPVAHAWLQQEGQPIALDITWDTGGCYFGIPFRSQWIAGLIQQREAIGSSERQVLNYRCQFSLRILRDGLQPGMVRGGFDVSAQPNG